MLETINNSKLPAVIYLPSFEFKNVKEGNPMCFLIDETGTTRHEGKVYEVSGYISPEVEGLSLKLL